MGKGRPSSYKEEYNEQAYDMCMLGYTDEALGKYFGVSEVTINSWKNKHPNFLKALKEGKELADAKVAKSLFKRAIGYSYKEIRFEKVVKDSNSDEDIELELYKKVVTIKEVAPDVIAQKVWLFNRQKERWSSDQPKEKPPVDDKPVLGKGKELPTDED